MANTKYSVKNKTHKRKAVNAFDGIATIKPKATAEIEATGEWPESYIEKLKASGLEVKSLGATAENEKEVDEISEEVLEALKMAMGDLEEGDLAKNGYPKMAVVKAKVAELLEVDQKELTFKFDHVKAAFDEVNNAGS